MQVWMDEFRKDRMQDYANSNPCMEQVCDNDTIAALKNTSRTFFARLFSKSDQTSQD